MLIELSSWCKWGAPTTIFKFNFPSVPSEHCMNLWRAKIWAPSQSHLMDERWNSVRDGDWSEGPGRSAVDSCVKKGISGPRSVSRVRWTLASRVPKTHSFCFKQSLWWFTLKKSDIFETTPHEFKAVKLCNIFYLCLPSSKDSKTQQKSAFTPKYWCFVPNKITHHFLLLDKIISDNFTCQLSATGSQSINPDLGGIQSISLPLEEGSNT